MIIKGGLDGRIRIYQTKKKRLEQSQKKKKENNEFDKKQESNVNTTSENLPKNKLSQTGIIKYFLEENVHIVGEKEAVMKKILEKYKNYSVYLVDDKLPILQTAKKFMPSITVLWIKRGIYAENQKEIKGFIPDVTVDDLHEVIRIVKYGKKK